MKNTVVGLNAELQHLGKARDLMTAFIGQAVEVGNTEMAKVGRAATRALRARRAVVLAQTWAARAAELMVGNVVHVAMPRGYRKTDWLTDTYGRVIRINAKTVTIDFGERGIKKVPTMFVVPIEQS